MNTLQIVCITIKEATFNTQTLNKQVHKKRVKF